jgi:hypothetical protein
MHDANPEGVSRILNEPCHPCGIGAAWLYLSYAKSIFVQFAIIFGLYARLETLYAHMTFARFAQGSAALHR